MARQNVHFHAFNVGVVDKDKLTRIDLERMRLAAETQTNLICTTTGKMFLRPGFGYLGSTYGTNEARLREFVRGADEAALLEFTTGVMRVWVDDALVTRPSVNTGGVTSGDFSASTGWTLAPTSGATATVSGGYLNLKASAKGSLALAKQQITTTSAGTEHALRIVIERGPVTFRCGSTEGGDEYIAEATLRTGHHSLAFTPSGNFWVQFQTDAEVERLVDYIQIESAGVLALPTPWAVLTDIRMAQSADVVFCAANGVKQYRIERRGDTSWSVVEYDTEDGPFSAGRTANVRLKPTEFRGNTTLTADKAFFREDHVGALFRLFHTGQNVYALIAGEDQYTDPIKVTGVTTAAHDDRGWNYVITGTWSGTLMVQRSFDGPDYGYQPYRLSTTNPVAEITANTSEVQSDDDDNAIVWYKIGFAQGDYTSGVAEINVSYKAGGDYGICRVTAWNSATEVEVEVLRPFKNTNWTDDWLEGEWSDYAGWPSAVGFFEGRLWWGGADRFWGSVSDDYTSYDAEFEGDAGPIARSIATGAVNNVQSIVPMQRLAFLTDGSEVIARSSGFDEPLTPSNTTLKNASTVGSAPIDPVQVDGRALTVDRSRSSIFEMVFNVERNDYSTTELSKLCTSLFAEGIKQVAVQRRPDTRIWVVTEDGGLACIVYEPDQEVVAFIPIETDGDVESVAVLPSTVQDRVYIAVKRTINGSIVRYVEKMALDSEVVPATQTKVMDAYVAGTQSASTTISVPHLIGETVVVWADGAPVDGEYTVSASGTITVPDEVESYVAGLGYRGRYKSARLAYGATGGTALLQRKKVTHLGLLMTDYVRAGIYYGAGFDDADHPLDPMPEEHDGETAAAIVSSDVHDEVPFVFDGSWNTDSRVCLEVSSPYTATFLGMVVSVDTND